MGPVPWPKGAQERAVAPVCNIINVSKKCRVNLNKISKKVTPM